MPTLYEPSISDEVVDNPEITNVSLLLKLWGLSEKITYSPFLLDGVISTSVTVLVATLTLVTDLPARWDTFPINPSPPVPVLSNTTSSFTR